MEIVSGIYAIICIETGDFYIGSTCDIARRWSEHRWALQGERSNCFRLQQVWTCYGENNFMFSLLEQCRKDQLVAREQHFLDAYRPELNIVRDASRRVSDRQIKKLVAFNRARTAAITHCPHGHAYDDADTYRNKKGKRICRACNAERVTATYDKETRDQRELRRTRVKEYHQKNRPQRLMTMQKYTAAHRSEKRDYDRRRREALKN